MEPHLVKDDMLELDNANISLMDPSKIKEAVSKKEIEKDEELDDEDEEGLSKYTGEGEDEVERRQKEASELMTKRAK